MTSEPASPAGGRPPTLSTTLGIEFVTVGPDLVVATMAVTPGHLQPQGILHGGASVALAETVASVGANAALAQPDQRVVGLEINANHLRAVRGGTVTATARPVHKGRSTQLWAIEIRDDEGRLVCVSRCTLAVLTPER